MFGIKNYKKIYFISLSLMTILSVFFLASTSKAHEMWIEPVKYSIKLGDKILANEIVGQDFKGNKYAYLDSSFEYINITVGENTKAVKSRLGDLPTIQEISREEGLHIITAETPLSNLTYETPEKFANFLNADGLQWVFAEHKRGACQERVLKKFIAVILKP